MERLAGALEELGLSVWLDRHRLAPGERWRESIRNAIRAGDLFLACFSSASVVRNRSHMNEELSLALDELRLRPNDRAWFIPVRLDATEIPELPISSRETVHDLQWADLNADWRNGLEAIARAAFEQKLLGARSTRVDSTAAVQKEQQQHNLHLDIVEARFERIARERSEAQEREHLLNSEAGVDAAFVECGILYDAISVQVVSLNSLHTKFAIELEVSTFRLVIRAAGFSVILTWWHNFAIAPPTAGVGMAQYRSSYSLFSGHDTEYPRFLDATSYSFDRQNGALGWSAFQKFMTTEELAGHCIQTLLGWVEMK